MGFAEIQAAFAAQGQAPAPQPVHVQTSPIPAVAQASAFTPSPFGAAVQGQRVAGALERVAPFNPATPTVQPPPAPAQASFQFTPPAGFNPASAPPINPPGERAALAAPAPAAPNSPVAAAPAEAPRVTAAPPAEPKRRGRKPKATAELEDVSALVDAAVRQNSLAADGADISKLPPDGSSVEDIVSELFARGVSSVHLTFTKDGK